MLATVLESKYRASKKLLEHTSAMIAGQQEYVLLDEQLVVFNSVLAQANEGFHDQKNVVLLVRGGPGTGKSVIAINLVGALSRLGFNAQHATGSKAFTGNIRRVVGPRASQQFKYWNIYGGAERNEIDALILDEAHRLRAVSTNRFTPRKLDRACLRSMKSFARRRCASSSSTTCRSCGPRRSAARSLSATQRHDYGAQLVEFELEAQFRCNGSEGFINWVDNTLDIRRTANVLWEPNEDSSSKSSTPSRARRRDPGVAAAEGHTARLTAGFCWPVVGPRPDGTLVPDVRSRMAMPWNAKPDAGRLAGGIPKANYWAPTSGGIDQVGCIYTAQGFEYDYAGVICGRDLGTTRAAASG